MIKMRVFEVGEDLTVNPHATYHTMTPCVPRIGEKISIQYWDCEVLDVIWDINNAKIPEVSVYVESMDILAKSHENKFKEVEL